MVLKCIRRVYLKGSTLIFFFFKETHVIAGSLRDTQLTFDITANNRVPTGLYPIQVKPTHGSCLYAVLTSLFNIDRLKT